MGRGRDTAEVSIRETMGRRRDTEGLFHSERLGRRRDAEEVSILVHGYRLADSGEKEGCIKRESDALKQWMEYGMIRPGLPLEERKPDPPQADAWFIIRDTAEEGLKVSEIFRGLREDDSLHSRTSSNCLLVGSKLYEIGGVGSTFSTRFHLSNKIRCLDTENPEAGWKTDTLPFHSGGATTTVSGKSIYLFPRDYPFMDSSSSNRNDWEWAYIYDTVEQKARPIQLPSESPRVYHTHPAICFPSLSSEEGNGIVVPLEDGGKGMYSHTFCLYNPDDSSWKSLEFYPKELCWHNQPYAISDGMLYVYAKKFRDLSVYDITKPRAPLLCKIRLSVIENLYECHHVFLVPLANSNICFLWRAHHKFFYARVSVSLDPPAATLVKQATLCINATDISDCLPFTIPQGMHLRQYNIGAEFPITVAAAKNLEQVEDLRRLCKRLLRHLEDLEGQLERSFLRRNKRRRRSLREEVHRVLANIIP